MKLKNCKKVIHFDPSNFDEMCDIMKTYFDQDIFFGENNLGEKIQASIFPDHIIISTFQHNNWIRVNTYWKDGTTEETYEK